MAYNHGIRVLEAGTSVAAPVSTTSGLQVVIGTAPVNLASDPTSCTNTPILVSTFEEAVEAVGYSDDFSSYTLCEAIDASFRVAGVGPLVLINVLDPSTHYTAVASKSYTVTDGQCTLSNLGMIASTLTVVSGEDTLVQDTDYVVSFDDDGYCVLTFVTTVSTITVSGNKLNPSAVTASDIIGAVDSSTGAETGLEVIRQVFPATGYVPSLIVAPGWSKNANVAAAMAEKCEGINGIFTCECIVDLDSSTSGATAHTQVGAVKSAKALTSEHMDVVWPCVKIGTKIYHGSAIKAAYTALNDENHGGIPYVSPSNVAIDIDGMCTEAGVEILLDELRANTVNGYGVSTFQNFNGWLLWGNRTAAYPDNTDTKDTWFVCRRFFSWWANTFILAYHDRVDSPTNMRQIEALVDEENVRGNSLVADGCCAGAYIEYREEDNTVDSLMDGKVYFYQHLAPFTPAEDVVNTLEFDPDLFAAAFSEEG